jgi:hypothetical protein
MARCEEHIPSSLDEALAELKRDPGNAVRARVEGDGRRDADRFAIA